MLKNNTIHLTKCISISNHVFYWFHVDLFAKMLIIVYLNAKLPSCYKRFIQYTNNFIKLLMLLNCHWHLQICIIFQLQWLFPQLRNYFHTTTFNTHACIIFKYLLYYVNNKTKFMQEWPADVAALRHHNDTFVSCGEHHVPVCSHTLPSFREVK